MASDSTAAAGILPRLRSSIPILDWAHKYSPSALPGDITAGLIVAIMLIPQSMAYALLAGLPPQVGLYSSILPLVVYAILGTGKAVSVAPVAIDSLLVATAVGAIAVQGSNQYILLASLLALMVGVVHLLVSVVKLGSLVNFISSSVILGFTNAAALVIGFSQLKHILGFDIPRSKYLHETIIYAATHMEATNVTVLAISLTAILTLTLFKNRLAQFLKNTQLSQTVQITLTRGLPLLIIIGGILVVWKFNLQSNRSVAIVGQIPAGMPQFSIPSLQLDQVHALLPAALTIAFVAFLENISVAKSLAAKRREKIDANQELVAIGTANIASALSGGYTVTGGFSRSAVNFSAGAQSGLASIITAGLLLVTTIFLTPLFYYLPKAVLGSLIIVAVFRLIDFKSFLQTWRYDKRDGMIFLVTFLAVLLTGIQNGILIGAGASIALFVWRTSQPHIAEVGRLGNTEHFRNVKRHEVQTCPHVLAMRIDESLYFGNIAYLENEINARIADDKKIDHLLLLGNGINFIDANALKALSKLKENLQEAGVSLWLAEIKGPVMDKLKSSGFIDELGTDRVFLSSHEAMRTLECV
ncbi:MAG: sulfate permease [Candidatus Marinimicrobia bacterium]|nr:sulfate permease [Candidatus Neomarinimicrobiota bacterium]